jgi:hypothetical protein
MLRASTALIAARADLTEVVPGHELSVPAQPGST